VSPCTRFEDEGLLQLERGEPLDEHFASCAECAQARAAYERLRRALVETGPGLEPADGWQDRVRARLDAAPPRREGPRRVGLVAALVGMAAAAAVVAVLRPPAVPPALKLDAHVESAGGEARRGISAHEGDRLVFEGTIDGRAFAELRVYRDDRRLVLRCSNEDPCRRTANGFRALLTVEARGRYQSVLLSADRALPAPEGELDRDVDASLAAGAHIALGPEIDVR